MSILVEKLEEKAREAHEHREDARGLLRTNYHEGRRDAFREAAKLARKHEDANQNQNSWGREDKVDEPIQA